MAVEWADDGVVLSQRPYGEHAVLLSVFTECHGRFSGIVQGGNSRHKRAFLQSGYHLHLRWAARLQEQLGQWSLDPIRDYAAMVLGDRGRLSALMAACALCEVCLPERQPYEAIHTSLKVLLDHLTDDGWASLYVHWELALLRGLGYGLDLSCCAATGETDDLIFVSPKSGRAVSRAAGWPYRERLLPLPGFLLSGGVGTVEDVRQGLTLTNHFILHHVLPPWCKGVMPSARSRLTGFFQA